MDNKALAEVYVDLYQHVCDNYEAQTGNQPTTAEASIIFEQTCKRIISDLIGKQRSSGGSTQTTQSDERPTDKQIAFANKLGCHNPEGFSKKELSAWIEENKTY